MIVRTFDTADAAQQFALRAGWPLAHQVEGQPTRYIDDWDVTRELRSHQDRHGVFWFWGRM